MPETPPAAKPPPDNAAPAPVQKQVQVQVQAQVQARNPLHGITLEAMVLALQAYYGWEELARRIPVRCFALDPSVKSSLKFLRKTPWAREKVEGLYLYTLREQARQSGRR